MSSLHRGDANGFAGLQEALDADDDARRKTKASDVLHDWSLMVALDSLIDGGARLVGTTREKRVTDTDARRLDQLGHAGRVLARRARPRTGRTTSGSATRPATS